MPSEPRAPSDTSDKCFNKARLQQCRINLQRLKYSWRSNGKIWIADGAITLSDGRSRGRLTAEVKIKVKGQGWGGAVRPVNGPKTPCNCWVHVKGWGLSVGEFSRRLPYSGFILSSRRNFLHSLWTLAAVRLLKIIIEPSNCVLFKLAIGNQ